MKHEVVKSEMIPGAWHAEATDDTGKYLAVFSGPLACECAEEYAKWRSAQPVPRKLPPPPPPPETERLRSEECQVTDKNERARCAEIVRKAVVRWPDNESIRSALLSLADEIEEKAEAAPLRKLPPPLPGMRRVLDEGGCTVDEPIPAPPPPVKSEPQHRGQHGKTRHH